MAVAFRDHCHSIYRPVFCFLFGLWAQPLLALWLCLRDRPLSPPTPQLSLELQSHGGLSLVTVCVVTVFLVLTGGV